MTETYLTVANHPKDSNLGTKQVRIGPKIFIEKEDAEALKEGHNATFINWGNLMIEKIKRENGKVVQVDASPNLDNKDFKNTLKLTWICADAPELKSKSPKSSAIPCYAVYFEHIMTKSILAKDDDFKDFVAKDTRVSILTTENVMLCLVRSEYMILFSSFAERNRIDRRSRTEKS